MDLKDVVKSLSLAKRELEVKCEESQAEIKRIHERQLVSQMAASPLLNQDTEDGWGSPEPEPGPQPEGDGWGEEDGLQAGSDLAEDGASNRGNLTEREADIEDGWGDDTWGGFGEEAGAGGAGGVDMLADNLR